MTIYSF